MSAAILHRRYSIVGVILTMAIFLPSNVAAQETNCTADPTRFGDVGDGECHEHLNTVECDFDGGDCCECTCVDNLFQCGDSSFVCLDPSCPDEAFNYFGCPGYIYTFGNGNCDDDNNYATCGYDGGDCCECTCVDSYSICGGGFGEFECLDPACPDEVHDQALLYPNCTGTVSTTGDGFCLSYGNNNPSCGYDGGDCCECTCIDGPEFSCASNGFNCLDPACPDEVSPYVDTCTGDILALSDATCDEENNNASCGYDGGDCCACTCVDTASQQCGVDEFPCVDPNAATELFECIEAPTVAPCPSDVQSDWVVEDTETATDLAEALNCSGGSFTAEWKGSVLIDRTIHIPSGTVLSVTGSDWLGAAGLDGNASVRIFTVTNGSLFLTNLHLSNGYSTVGGAIAASESSVVLDNITFTGNTASNNGGALYVVAETLVSWTGMTQFIGNIATNRGGGGAFYDGSRATWAGETTFSSNSAENGGALYVIDGSSITCNKGTTTFSNNSAGFAGGALYASSQSLVTGSGDFLFLGNIGGWRGALYIDNATIISWDGAMGFHENWSGYYGGYYGGGAFIDTGSSILWNGNVTFSGNVGQYGGALHVSGASSVSWGGKMTSFTNNSASYGGALYVYDDSSISWSGNTSFGGNIATSESHSSTFYEDTTSFGGALYVSSGSKIVGSGETMFSDNFAKNGGALAVNHESNVFWTGTMMFIGNVVEGGSFTDNSFQDSRGGALYASGNANISWDGSTTFAENIAESGGGLFAEENATLSWGGKTTFSRNRAWNNGGAIFSDDGSTISWGADTTFDNNVAGYGGAIFMGYNSIVSWNGETLFASNTAHSDGGAVGSSVSDAAQIPSSILINGATTFLENTCGVSGGGIAVTGALAMTFETTADTTFSGNTAGVSGGAVFVSGAGIGPVFTGVMFISNSAQAGGAVYTTGSGTAITKDENGDPKRNPSTSDRCEFIGNTAKATGGAMESGAGLDSFNNTLFEGNSAGVGGALRLAGTASLFNCSFIENTSHDDQGPAVSNIGFIFSISEITFSHNVFACEPTMFLEYDNERVALYETVCSGCTTPCTTSGCDIIGQEPSCSDQLEHSNSTGGDVNVSTLLIEEGYWRATSTSKYIFECLNTDACQGGVTGSSGYCSDGYTGPYCSICSDGYAAGAQNVCTECSNKISGIVLLVVITIFATLAAVAFMYYLASTEMEGDARGLLACVMKLIPLHSFKIVIVTWQILTQFTDIANVIYPDIYSEFLDGVALLNFDLGWVLSTACVVDTDFHDRLLISTIGPLICAVILGATYTIAMRRNRGSDAGRAHVRHRHLSMLLFLTFFVYSSVTSTLFRMFACENLDDGKNYLRADYQIECDSAKHETLQIYASIMIALYTVGIPLVYATLLLRNRGVLVDKDRREQDQHVNSIADLWEPYKPNRFYYEVIECSRRVLLAGVVVFIYPNTAAQVAVALMMAVFFVFLSEGLAPYESRWDAWLSRTGHAIVFTSMYLALLLKVDVSDERSGSQSVFEVVLVSAHVFMVVAVVVESLVVGFHFRKNSAEVPEPKFRQSGAVSFVVFPASDNISPEGRTWPGHVDDEVENRSQVEECKKS